MPVIVPLNQKLACVEVGLEPIEGGAGVPPGVLVNDWHLSDAQRNVLDNVHLCCVVHICQAVEEHPRALR